MREEQPMKVELYIDIKTARTLGIRLTEIASRMGSLCRGTDLSSAISSKIA